MKIHTLRATQRLPLSMEEAWKFLTDPKNLRTITPDYMGFHILSGADQRMYPGQIIAYLVTPIWGIRTHWVTEITHFAEGSYFVDEQRFGPYSLWHHKHFIREVDGGVEMEDLVHYKLPLGILGNWLHPFLVRPKLKEIFQYRKNKLEKLFGTL